jgi:putative DNA primase/helicase
MTQTATALTFQDLKRYPQWVCFAPDKQPYNPHTGYGAKANDTTTWASYETALRVWRKDPTRYSGIGFEFVREQGLVGVDLDKCIDDQGNIEDFAQSIIDRLNSYTEYSPSGHGVHIWVRGSIPKNMVQDAKLIDTHKKLLPLARVEMYFHSHYFTITGNRYEGTPDTFEDRTLELAQLYSEITEQRQKAKTRTRTKAPATLPSGDTAYGLKALTDECSEMEATSEGGRNHKLNEVAFRLGQLVGGNELSRSTVERELSLAAAHTDLSDREIEKTMQSGLDAGIQRPRTRPEDEKPDNQQPAPNKATGLSRFTPDDAGNGDALYALCGDKFLYCGAIGWLFYNGTHWELDPDTAKVRKAAVAALRARRHEAVELGNESVVKCTVGDEKRVNGCISRFKTLVAVKISEFDNDPDLLNCKSGVLDFRTGTLTPHSHTQRFTYCVPLEYEETNTSEWLAYLSGIVGGGREVIDYLQMALGYSLTGHTSEECLFYTHGPTRSGKSTIAEVMTAILPNPLSTMVDFNSFTAKREGDVSNFDLAELKPARLIFASESQRNQSLNPAKIKQLTGGDLVRACFKHKDFFAYRPQFKVWMLSNWPVNGDPEDDALWGRVRVISFPNSFLGKEDKTKKARLKSPEVLKSIFYWVVQGAIKWRALGPSGLQTPEYVALTTKKQRAELDFVQQWLDECCTVTPGAWTANETVIASYTQWCEANNVSPKKARGLAQSLQTKGFATGVQKWQEGRNQKGVAGLAIKSSTLSTFWTENEGFLTDNGSNGSNPIKKAHYRETENTQNHPLDPLSVRNETREQSTYTSDVQPDGLEAELDDLYNGRIKPLLNRKHAGDRLMWRGPGSEFEQGLVTPDTYRQHVEACRDSHDRVRMQAAIDAMKRTLGVEVD